MRTTLVLDDDVYERVRERAFRQRRPIGAVLSEAARRGLMVDEGVGMRRPLGKFASQGWVADDFADTPPEWFAAVDSPVDPADDRSIGGS